MRASVGSRKTAAGTIEQRQQSLLEFREAYEMLLDTICDAAHYGPDEKLDASYTWLRAKIYTTYGLLKPFLISYLEFHPSDAEAGLKLSGRPLDAFEALVAAFDLQEFLKMDDGNMISRINRTREALNLYGLHLDQLAARLV